MLDYVYAVMWLIIAIFSFLNARKLGKILYVSGIYFTIFSIWKFIDIFVVEINLFKGLYGIAFRIITAVFLVIMVGFYIKNKKNSVSNNK